MKNIYLLEWTEYESGWGCRPDGIQIFVDYDYLAKVVSDDATKRRAAKTTPFEYSIPEGKIVAQVNDEDFKKISDSIGEGASIWLTEAGKRSVDYMKKEFPSLVVVATETLK